MVLNCMIVDDDLIDRKSLERLCKKIEALSLVKVCENGKQALEALSKQKIDLVFLDIEMPELTGIDFLRHAVSLPQVIFTTSNTDYGIEAFEYQVTDYLKKPIAFPRFRIAVEKALDNHIRNHHYRAVAEEVYIREEGRLVRVPYADILYFENVGDYIRLKTTDSHHIIHGTLKSIDAKLTSPRFLRVHRSFVINLGKIKDIKENTLVIDKKVIPISRTQKPVLMSKLNLL